MFGSDGQRRVHKESRGVIKPKNLQDHSCWPHNKAKEQAYITAEEHQSRRWDEWIYIQKDVPQGAGIPKFYGLPKIHKEGVPLRPIVSSRGAVSYETAKKLARILKPLVGKSPYSDQNTRDFVQQVNIQLLQPECIISYDVKALFTLVPIEPAIEIIKKQKMTTNSNKEHPWQSITSSVCWSSV